MPVCRSASGIAGNARWEVSKTFTGPHPLTIRADPLASRHGC